MELQRVGHDWAPFTFMQSMGFPGSSAGKESTCNAGDPSSISGLGRPPGERIGYPLQYSWASPVAQTVKNPPAMRKTLVRSLGWEDSLEEGLATHSSILAWRIPWTEELGGLQSVQSGNVRHDWVTKHSTAQSAEEEVLLTFEATEIQYYIREGLLSNPRCVLAGSTIAVSLKKLPPRNVNRH